MAAGCACQRLHFIASPGHIEHGWVPAAASPNVVPPPLSDSAGVDPEEALVVALSSCHMLAFLWLCAKHGLAVASYEDCAIGVMTTNDRGREWVPKVALRPQVSFDGGKRLTQADVEALHHKAHEGCNIAAPVKTEITLAGCAFGTM
jgi:organic hydroperoxide reductase OsmC/OhrA